MAFECRIEADSLAPCGARLTTYVVTYPRAIHSEIMTHRMLTKSSASSRAIPTDKIIQRVLDDPWIPSYIGKNQKGMQAGELLDEPTREKAVTSWLRGRDAAVERTRELLAAGVHKQIANRLLEPWMWITVIISGTTWSNFFGLRCHEAAEPHFQHIARMMKSAYETSTPRSLSDGEWHLPFVKDEDYEDVILADPTHPLEVQRKLIAVSVGRCARVSYLNHDGKRDLKDDIALHDRLMAQRPLHAAPAEHVAQAMSWSLRNQATVGKYGGIEKLRAACVATLRADGIDTQPPDGGWADAFDFRALAVLTSGNYCGFRQYRKTFADEHIGGSMF